MNVAEMRAKLKGGGRVWGTLVTSPSPHWVGPLAAAGLDFVFIDTEHIALGRETVAWMCRAYAAAGLAPIVRAAIQWPRWGCSLIVQHADFAYAARGLADELRAMREAFGRAGAGEAQSFNV